MTGLGRHAMGQLHRRFARAALRLPIARARGARAKLTEGPVPYVGVARRHGGDDVVAAVITVGAPPKEQESRTWPHAG